MLDVPSGSTVKLPFPATHIVVRWDGSVYAVVEARGVGADGIWQPWQRALAEEDGGATQEGGMLVFDDVVAVESRVLSGEANGVRAAAIDTENGPRSLRLVSGAGAAQAIGGNTAQPDVISRAEWGADESIRKGAPEFAKVSRVIVHHTVTSNTDPNPAATVRAIYAWHTQGNGWNDIGYNFLIDQSGRVYEGRFSRSYRPGEEPTGESADRLGVVGAHAVNNNTGTIGIAMLGTFTTASPTQAQQDSLARLAAWSADRNGIDPLAAGAVVGHSDVGETDCPGEFARSLLPQIRKKVAALSTLAFPPGNTPGYWVASKTGNVAVHGKATSYGSMAGRDLNATVISMARAADAKGYWLLGTDGGIFSFGSARFFGSTGNIRLNKPIVGMAATPSGNGYWLVAADGGIFAYGDAKFLGSTGAISLNKPIVGMSPTPSGNGYWLVASDGGIFAYGDAKFHGSTGAMKLNSPVVTIATAPSGNGYWLVAGDGGVFAFNAAFYGSIPLLGLTSFGGTTQATATATGKGYYMLGGDGGVYTFGDARFLGAGAGGGPAAAIALVPE